MCRTWMPSGNFATAPAQSSFKRRAPWLPPVTKIVVFCGSKPKSAAASARVGRDLISGRTGVPVSTVARPPKKLLAASRPRNTCVQKRLVRTLARPGRALESCTKVLRPSLWPAYTGGSEVKPPMPSTASAPKLRRIPRQRRIEPQSFHKNGSIRSEKVAGLATAGTVSKLKCGYLAEASASTFFSEIKSRTSCPRARIASATAMPGNK